MTPASRWLRRAEISLWVIGLSLLGVALGAVVHRWMDQAEQERAFVRSAAASQLPPREIESVPRAPDSPGGSAALPSPSESLDTKSDMGTATAETLPASSETERHGEDSPKTPSSGKLAIEAESSNDVAIDPGLVGRIEIPRLGLRAIVREGDDESTLRRAVGHVRGTARPGEGGNTALAGHRDTFFRSLRDIRLDDRIRFLVPPHTYEYSVTSVRVVEPTEVSVLESNGTEELTLITCHPFRFIGPAPNRFIVKATRVR